METNNTRTTTNMRDIFERLVFSRPAITASNKVATLITKEEVMSALDTLLDGIALEFEAFGDTDGAQHLRSHKSTV